MKTRILYQSLEPIFDIIPFDAITHDASVEADIPDDKFHQWIEVKKDYDNMQSYLRSLYFGPEEEPVEKQI